MSLNQTITLGHGNDTAVGWVSEPSYRGTLSILISCLSTLILCTWSVMHLNIPEKNASRGSYAKRYCTWGLIGIFGPELAIWAAWRQFLSAKALRDEVRHLQAANSKIDAKIHQPWTLTHGYYAAMGGFVIDLDSEELGHGSTFTEKYSRLTLTPKGVRLLAECGYLPKITVEEINDKSKTDELGKALACLQAIWMIIQVCDRLALKLPVTLLEITTIGHVLCALVLYSLWWCKPRWIQEPTKIENPSLTPIFALMLMASQISHIGQERSWLRAKFDARSSEISNLVFRDADVASPETSSEDTHPESDASATSSGPDTLHTTEKPSPTPHLGAFVVRSKTAYASQPGFNEDLESLARGLSSDELTSKRHTLAAEAIATHPAIRKLLHTQRSSKERQYYDAIKMYPEMPHSFRAYRHQPATPKVSRTHALECDTEHLVTFVASDWPTDGLLRAMDRTVDRVSSATSSGLVISAFLWLASIGFAGVHIAGWHAAFPSIIEAWLWRASSAFIGLSGVIWLAISVLAQFSKHIWWLWFDLLSDDAPRWCKVILLVMCGLCGSGYVFSRIYVIVEAFVSLRTLPVATFVVPQWTLSVPHL